MSETIAESDFWPRLARRINAELGTMRNAHLRFLWVDDILPETSPTDFGRPTVAGRAFVSEDDGRSFV